MTYKNIVIHRNPTKIFLFLAPNKGLKFKDWDTHWLLIYIPYLFSIQIYWDK